MSSSGSKPPFATISSASWPTSVLRSYNTVELTNGRAEKVGSAHFSAMCCLNRSPVEMDRMSNFRARRAVRVPLPAPGLPNMIMRNTLPLGWDESSASGAAAERELRKRNGRAVWVREEVENSRGHIVSRVLGRRQSIVNRSLSNGSNER